MFSAKGEAVAAGEATAAQAPAWSSPAQAFALIERLNASLLASHSATSTLEQWRPRAGPGAAADGEPIRARRIAGADRPATMEQRARLGVGPRQRVIYRRVELACGGRVLCEAENWYAPGRLTAAIRKVLAQSDTPFGRAVAELRPVRETFAVELLWRPEQDGAAGAPQAEGAIPWRLFEHRALVFGANGLPIAEVREAYTREILTLAPPVEPSG